ncbi:MAG: chemotaxis protein CheA [Syntrophobacteraceae bacterium]|nr:chemotaxis protein CheA [Syntrophobacteraceae bacterium]
MIDGLMETFRIEAEELLSELEAALLVLETASEDSSAIGRVFRCLHTIKGSGGMAGFDDIAAFAHEIENVLESVRKGDVPVTRDLIDRVLSAADLIHTMLEDPDPEASRIKSKEIIAALGAIILPAGSPRESGGEVREKLSKESRCAGQEGPVEKIGLDGSKLTTYRIFFRPNGDIFTRGVNPCLLLSELSGLGECQRVACVDALPDLDEINPQECFTSWNIILSTPEGIDAIKDVFIFVEDDCELTIEPIGDHASLQDLPPKKLGEMLVERGDLTPEQVEEVLGKQKRLGELLIDEGVVSSGQVQAALMEQHHLHEIREKKKDPREKTAASVRVSAEKLDSMVDLVGELVTVQASLRQLALSKKIPELRLVSEQVDRLTAELRDNTMSLRMLPIGTTFGKFNRLIRDLSQELGKEISLTTEGSEVELDKTVIERLHDPLVHMIRNSIDHGVETPEVRVACGKDRKGTLRLSAEHSGAHVLVKIADDGAGLDPEAILKRGVERGLVPHDGELSQREIFSLIFAQGFSTATEVTSVSGRGVGMDVVKRAIDSLGGSIEISSLKGAGTTITLKLPLTLAIIDGLLVKVGDCHFVLPLSFIEECVELTAQEAGKNNGRQLTVIRQKLVPYIRLRDLFSINGESPPIEQIAIAETSDGKVGFVVDKVIGQYQTVIKNLGKIYRNVKAISGTTILGDGSVAPIVDIPRIVNLLVQEEINRKEITQKEAV